VRIAVTGATGFCGGAIAARAAARGDDVTCLGRSPAPAGRHVPWDATGQPPDLSGIDFLVHCAAAVSDVVIGSRSEAYMRQVNADGAARLLKAAAHIPVVWVSSASVYDPSLERSCIREDHPVRGQLNAYGRTKAEGERLALDAGAIVLRPRAVYGHGDSQLIPRLVKKARAGILPLPGPDVLLSLTALENLVEACLQAADWPPGAYNISDAKPYKRDDTLRQVMDAYRLRARLFHVPIRLANIAGAASEAFSCVGPKAGLDPLISRYTVDQLAHTVVLDISKARRQGWRPHRTLFDFLHNNLDLHT
jgi:nucleoside-diphosphate-sugar epimerase